MSQLSNMAALLAIVLAASVTRDAGAQSTGGPESPRRTATGALIAGGVLGGIAGMYLGIHGGSIIDHDVLHHTRACDCPRWGAAAGAGIGATLGIVAGVHAFNRGRGRFGPVLGRTAVTIAGFWAASYAANRLGAGGVDDALVLAGVAAGIYTAVRTERGTTAVPVVSVTLNTP